MKRFYFLPAIVLLLLFSLRADAQIDPHFSQYYAYPLWLNPALTGVHDGDYRATANYKNQWSAISQPYTTEAASLDISPGDKLGLGLTVLNQAAGDGGYNDLTAMASAAYRIRFGQEGFKSISFGMQAGFSNRRFDPTKLTFGDQYTPGTGFNGTIPSGENFASTSGTIFNLNAGLMFFDGNPETRSNPFFGVAVANITHPENPLVGNQTTQIPIRYTIHGGLRIRSSDDFDVTPNVLYMRQGNAEEISAGLSCVLKLANNNDFLFGASARYQDAAIGYIGFRFQDITMGLSYDVNTSNLVKASSNRGGLELSLSYSPHKKPAKADFICPRL